MTKLAGSLNFLLFLSLLLLCTVTCVEDPEVKLCKKQCKSQPQFEEAQKKQCIHGCEEYGRMKREIERRTQPGVTQEEPERKLAHCRHECRVSRHISEPVRHQCMRQCEKKYWEEIGERKTAELMEDIYKF